MTVEWRQTARRQTSGALSHEPGSAVSFFLSCTVWKEHGSSTGVGISYGILAPVLVAPVEGLFHSSSTLN